MSDKPAEFAVEVFYMEPLGEKPAWTVLGGTSQPYTFRSEQTAYDFGTKWVKQQSLPPTNMRVVELVRL